VCGVWCVCVCVCEVCVYVCVCVCMCVCVCVCVCVSEGGGDAQDLDNFIIGAPDRRCFIYLVGFKIIQSDL